MRVLLHIGMTKAGSSALQAGLFAVRRELPGCGVLYPDGGRVRNSQILLLQGLLPAERLPRGLQRLYGGDIGGLERDMHAWMAGVETAIDATRPHTLILSEEFLFYVVDESALTELRRRMLSLGHTVEVVVYVRRPSEHYLSSVQQLLKASHRIPGPNPVAYRPTIEGYANHVADRMHVVEYDRSDWPDGDILRHFLTAFVPDANACASVPLEDVNESLSAEAMSLLAEYRERIWPDQHNRFTEDTNLVVRALAASDMEVAGDRAPSLHEHVARRVDQTSTDLPWLRETHGIVFDGVDYSAIQPAADHHPPLASVDCMCPVDSSRRDELDVARRAAPRSGPGCGRNRRSRLGGGRCRPERKEPSPTDRWRSAQARPDRLMTSLHDRRLATGDRARAPRVSIRRAVGVAVRSPRRALRGIARRGRSALYTSRRRVNRRLPLAGLRRTPATSTWAGPQHVATRSVVRELDVESLQGHLDRLATRPPVTVIVPIHDAYDDVRRCLASLERNTSARDTELLLIDDASADPRIGGLLEGWGRRSGVRTLRNDTNQGYTRTVNRAIAACAGDVVLLNSDCEVTPRWLEHLAESAYRDAEDRDRHGDLRQRRCLLGATDRCRQRPSASPQRRRGGPPRDPRQPAHRAHDADRQRLLHVRQAGGTGRRGTVRRRGVPPGLRRGGRLLHARPRCGLGQRRRRRHDRVPSQVRELRCREGRAHARGTSTPRQSPPGLHAPDPRVREVRGARAGPGDRRGGLCEVDVARPKAPAQDPVRAPPRHGRHTGDHGRPHGCARGRVRAVPADVRHQGPRALAHGGRGHRARRAVGPSGADPSRAVHAAGISGRGRRHPYPARDRPRAHSGAAGTHLRPAVGGTGARHPGRPVVPRLLPRVPDVPSPRRGQPLLRRRLHPGRRRLPHPIGLGEGGSPPQARVGEGLATGGGTHAAPTAMPS